MPVSSTNKPIVLPDFEVMQVVIRLIGISPLITHAWGEKAKAMMRDAQQGKARTKKAPKVPEDEFNAACYHFPGGGYGFPVIGFKACAVRAANDAGIPMTIARRAFHVSGELDANGNDLVRIEAPNPGMREDMVKLNGQTADMRYRPQFWPWSVTLGVNLNPTVISPDQLVNLFRLAGFGVGIGEWRPEKNGTFGRFKVEGDSI